jgi:hypothetical protein
MIVRESPSLLKSTSAKRPMTVISKKSSSLRTLVMVSL